MAIFLSGLSRQEKLIIVDDILMVKTITFGGLFCLAVLKASDSRVTF